MKAPCKRAARVPDREFYSVAELLRFGYEDASNLNRCAARFDRLVKVVEERDATQGAGLK